MLLVFLTPRQALSSHLHQILNVKSAGSNMVLGEYCQGKWKYFRNSEAIKIFAFKQNAFLNSKRENKKKKIKTIFSIMPKLEMVKNINLQMWRTIWTNFCHLTQFWLPNPLEWTSGPPFFVHKDKSFCNNYLTSFLIIKRFLTSWTGPLSTLFSNNVYPNISTTPLRQWGFRQCLPFRGTPLP